MNLLVYLDTGWSLGLCPGGISEFLVKAACLWTLSVVTLYWWPQYFVMGSALEGSRGVLGFSIDGNTVNKFRMHTKLFGETVVGSKIKNLSARH